MAFVKILFIKELDLGCEIGKTAVIIGSELLAKGEDSVFRQSGIRLKVHDALYSLQPDIIVKICFFLKVSIEGCAGEYIQDIKDYAQGLNLVNQVYGFL